MTSTLMKQALLAFTLGLLMALPSQAQVVVATTNFDDLNQITGTYDPALESFSDSDDVWGIVSSLAGIDLTDNFLGAQDVENDDNPRGNDVVATFGPVDVSAIGAGAFSFSYDIDGFDNGDDVFYTLTVDGLAQSEVALTATSGTIDGTVSVPFDASAMSVTLEIRIDQNGGGDQAGFDDITVAEIGAIPETAEVTFGAVTATTTEDSAYNGAFVYTLSNDDGDDSNNPSASGTVSVTSGANQIDTFTAAYNFAVGTTDGATLAFSATPIDDNTFTGSRDAVFELAAMTAEASGTLTLTITDDEMMPVPDFVINEIQADPDATNGDANGDGVVDTSQDEFVELVNTSSSSIDISGFTISDAVQVRHTFAPGTVVSAGAAVVVFGGGTPTGSFGGAVVVTASSNALGLNNGGDTIMLSDASGTPLLTESYGSSAGNNQSIARDPDLTGGFVQHSTIVSNPVLFSPGLRNTDGTPFVQGTGVTTSSTVGWRLLSSPVSQTVDDLAQINLVSGAGGYVVGANCAPGGTNTGQGIGITNLFTGYTGDPSGPNGGYVSPGTGATIEPGAGFFWYFFGDTPAAGQPSSCDDGANTSTTQALPITLNADGTSSFGARTVTITDGNDADGFYMLGNPFDNAYDVSAITATEDGTANAVALQAGVQLWDPEIGDYVVYTMDGAGDTSDADTDDVSLWQGFFMERSGADTGTDVTFAFDPSGIQSGVEGDGFVARQAADESALLSFQVTDGTRTGAAAIVRFEETADAAWDRFDLSKLAPFTSDFVQVGPVGQDRDGTLVTKAVESLSSELDGSVEVPFAFATSATEGTFTMSWPRVTLPAEWTATLTDLVANETTDLLAASDYTFEHSASAPVERFVVTVSAPAVAEEEGAQAFELTALSPNPTAGTARMALTVEATETVTVQVYDALGRLVATVFSDVVTAGAPRAISVPTAGLSAGAYVVRVQGTSFAEARRLTVTR